MSAFFDRHVITKLAWSVVIVGSLEGTSENYSRPLRFPVRKTPRISLRHWAKGRNDIFLSRGKFRGCFAIPTLYLTALVICRYLSSPRRRDYMAYLNYAKVNFAGITRDAPRRTGGTPRRRLFFLAKNRIPFVISRYCRRAHASRLHAFVNAERVCVCQAHRNARALIRTGYNPLICQGAY